MHIYIYIYRYVYIYIICIYAYIYNAVHYCTDFGTNTLVRVSCVRKEMVSLFLATVPKEKENV